MMWIILTGYIWLYRFSRLYERTWPSRFVSLSGLVRVYWYCPEITGCLDEPDCTVSPDRLELPVWSGWFSSMVEIGRPSSSDCLDLPDCLYLSTYLVAPHCPRSYTSFLIGYLQEVWGSCSGWWDVLHQGEPGEFRHPRAIWGIHGTPWVMNVQLIRYSYDSDSWASRLFGRVSCPLPDRGSRYWICTGSTPCSGGMGLECQKAKKGSGKQTNPSKFIVNFERRFSSVTSMARKENNDLISSPNHVLAWVRFG